MEEKVKEHLNRTHEKEFVKTKTRHVGKLEKLMEKKNRKQDDNRMTDKWICNLSKHQLTAAERSVLACGLNYAITPKNIPH